MSILIKGMEMPKEGSAFAIAIHPDGTITSWTGREMPQYEAVPVPAHGRLIDADALVDKHFGKEFLSKVMTADEDDLGTALVNIPLVINNAPTIIPAEEGET